MSGIDLTIRGSSASKNRMVTDQTLDREGFFIPVPPQKYNQDKRAKSAVGLGRREKSYRPFGNIKTSMNRPKSAHYTNLHKYDETSDNPRPDHSNPEPDNRDEIQDLMTTQKMEVNQKWVYQGEHPKWKPRNSQVKPIILSKPRNNTVKQRISVCEVMAKMRARSPDNGGSAAPPTSPKSSKSKCAVLGKRFISENTSPPISPVNESPYLMYAKSRHRTNPNIMSYSYLQKDMSVTPQPASDVIEIPTMDGFNDEPDYESVAVVEDRPGYRPSSNVSPQTAIYNSVYLKDYKEYPASNYRAPGEARLERPKWDQNYIRYSPNTYRFHDHRYTKNMVINKVWDRTQPRPPVGNSKIVSTRRPSQSLYVAGAS